MARQRKKRGSSRKTPAAAHAEAGGPRAFWSGTITFGLVSVPVELFPANRSSRVAMRMLTEDGVPLRRRYWCPSDEKEVGDDDLVRGYEVDDGEHVVVTDEELDELAPRRSRDIDLRRFVPADDVDPALFERAYFLAPGSDVDKPYRLLAEVMERTGRAGIATFVMRGKEYLVAILAEGGILRAETLRFADEVRRPQDVGLPDPRAVDRKAASRVRSAVTKLRADEIDRDLLVDERSRRLQALVQRKVEDGEDVVEAPAGAASADDGADAGGHDLLEAIRRSLGALGNSGHRRQNGHAGNGHGGRGRAEPSNGHTARRGDGGTAAGARSAAALDDLTKSALYDRAARLDVPGRSSMSKSELIRALRKRGA